MVNIVGASIAVDVFSDYIGLDNPRKETQGYLSR